MKYPFVLLYRYDKYADIDRFFEENKEKALFSLTTTSNREDLNKLFDSSNHLLITYGPKDDEYNYDVNSVIPARVRTRWIHYTEIDDIDKLNTGLNYCYIHNVTMKHADTRPIFSLFTTCYNSYDKIYRAYNSLKNQTLKDWEWVILDDSPSEDHFIFLKSAFKNDKRIRLYKRCENSGSIGNVKNEAVLLCRGKYVLEMDHDDEILPDVLSDATTVFDRDPAVGFVYMDCTNLYEDGANFSYGNFFGLGYSGYYCQKYKNQWINVASHPNINNISLSHIVGVPNHPRIWRKSALIEMGNYSEFLPISDDYELLLRTAVNTKMARIHKLGYIQYMNNNNNNFSLIRNSEINRLCGKHLMPQCYAAYNIHGKMKELNAYEDETYLYNRSQIWKRENYEYKYCNDVINLNHKKQYCIIGLNALKENIEEIRELYNTETNDFFVLENTIKTEELCRELDYLRLDRMKCYAMDDCTDEQLVNYFHLLCRSCEDYHIYNNVNQKKSEPIINLETLQTFKKSTKKMTIITPCIRPKNLLKIKESIDLDYVDEWIIVYDGKKITENPNMFNNDKIKEYVHIGDGISGNPQRNFALDILGDAETYIYFLDDDNIIHPDLYKLLDLVEDDRIYTFDQARPKGVFPYKELLKGNFIEIQHIDSAMALIDYSICKKHRWIIDKYDADGYFIKSCYEENKSNWIYIANTLAYYNKVDGDDEKIDN